MTCSRDGFRPISNRLSVNEHGPARIELLESRTISRQELFNAGLNQWADPKRVAGMPRGEKVRVRERFSQLLSRSSSAARNYKGPFLGNIAQDVQKMGQAKQLLHPWTHVEKPQLALAVLRSHVQTHHRAKAPAVHPWHAG